MVRYRFFYRDLDEITSRNRRIAVRFAALVRKGEAAIGALADGLVASGAMRASADERIALARNVTLVSTYWMSYHRIRDVAPGRAPAGQSAPDPALAARQVLALIAPFLVGDARALVDRLGADYR
jgi:hypothetical protein